MKGKTVSFFFSLSQLYCIFWLSFCVFPSFMEHIEVDFASATFFLFKVLCRRRNGEIVCLQIPAAWFSVHSAFPHFPPVNKLWTSKVALHWGETTEGAICPYLYGFTERERETKRKRNDARFNPFKIEHLMSRDLLKIKTMLCNTLHFFHFFCCEELSIAISLAKFSSNLTGLKLTSIIRVCTEGFHKENSDRKSQF